MTSLTSRQSATPRKSFFLVLEGTEGVGKSTNIEFIKTYLESKDVPLVLTREPGGTPLAEEIRELLLAPRDEAVAETTELLLMFAARAQHLQQVILPALEEEQWVLSDRFTDATYAYQGGGRKMDIDKIKQLEILVQGEIRPDKIIILDLSVEEGLKRARQRADLDRFEQEEMAFFERVRAAYLDRAKADPDRYFIVDASQSLPEVQSSIQCVLDELMAKSTLARVNNK